MTAAVSMHPPNPAGQPHHGDGDDLAGLQHWRAELYACFGRRADGLMDLVDALAGSQHVDGLAHLSLQAAYRCGWASTYEVVRNGRIDVQRLRVLLAGTRPLSAGQPVYAVDVTTWPRRAAECSPCGNGTTIRCGTPAASRWWPPGCTRGCASWA